MDPRNGARPAGAPPHWTTRAACAQFTAPVSENKNNCERSASLRFSHIETRLCARLYKSYHGRVRSRRS
jgi:hypothetical protein